MQLRAALVTSMVCSVLAVAGCSGCGPEGEGEGEGEAGEGEGDVGEGEGEGDVGEGEGDAGEGEGEGEAGEGEGEGEGESPCPPEQVLCGDRCVDPLVDPDFCGAAGDCQGDDAGEACGDDRACSNGTCCGAGLVGCDGGCVNTVDDEANCGGCGVVCGAREACFAGACRGDELVIGALTDDACAAVDHNATTGDDRGGIAVAAGNGYYTGDSGTGRFPLGDLAGAAPFGAGSHDGLFTDLLDGRLLSLAVGGAPFQRNVHVVEAVDGIAVLDPVSGAVVSVLPLSAPLVRGDGESEGDAVFAGRGRVGIALGSALSLVDLGSGVVTTVTIPALNDPRSCENWAYWGVLERFGGEDAVAYVNDDDAVLRTYLRDGRTERIAAFADLSDLCSFTVDAENGRWVWHHEFDSQLANGSELFGACDATVCSGSDCCPAQRPDACGDVCVNTLSDESNCGACGIVCGAGDACFSGRCLGEDLQVQALSNDACVDVDPFDIVQFDSSAVAVADGAAYYSGDAAGRFPLPAFTGATTFGTQRYDGLFTDVLDGRLLSLAIDGVPYNEDNFRHDPSEVDGIVELDPLTGEVVATLPFASAPTSSFGDYAIFAGRGRVGLALGRDDVLSIIDLASGEVTETPLPPLAADNSRCFQRGRWGVLERFGDEDAVAYVSTDPSNTALLLRTFVKDGRTETLTNLGSAADVCGLALDVAGDRWVRSTRSLTTGELAFGACDATLCNGVDCPCAPTRPDTCGDACVDLDSDTDNCGACGNVCDPGRICDDGVCGCPSFVPDVCDNACVDLDNDDDNCGVCGNVCAAGRECDGGACVCDRRTPDSCSGVCVDLQTDPENCGGCGVTCDDDQGCALGGCVDLVQGVFFEHFDLPPNPQVLPDFDALTPAASGVQQGFGLGSRANTELYAIRFRAALAVPAAGIYTFSTNSDDGSRLFIDGVLVVDNDGLHGPVTVSGTADLTAGLHDLEVQFFENSGGDGLEVRWSGQPNDPGGADELIPDAALFTAP